MLAACCPASRCSRKPDPNTVVVIIESSPTNLDPRVGLDAQSERIGELLFDSLVRRDEHFELQPGWRSRGRFPIRKRMYFTCTRECSFTTASH